MRKEARLDYRKELEKAAKQMILIHRVDTLIRLVLRTIIRNLRVRHAGFLLWDKAKNEYVVKVSRGREGFKVPSGFAKVANSNSLIRYFTDAKLRIFGPDFLLVDELHAFINSNEGRGSREVTAFFEDLAFQFSLYNASVCIPGFFRGELICILFLGQKLNCRKFSEKELGFISVLSSDVVMAIQNAWFFQDLNRQLQINKKLFLQTALALASAIEAKDKHTLGHTERVASYALVLAEEIRIMKKIYRKDWDKFIENLKIASLLHDVGKIGIPEAIFNKKGFLNRQERKEIEKHPLVGFSILKQIDEFQEPILGVKYHHERYDGKGYPEGLKGKKIPIIAQIISVVDTFDAMTTNRPYRKKLSREKVAQTIEKSRGERFSPLAVDAFLRIYRKGKI